MKSLKVELLDMAAEWKVAAVSVLEMSPAGSHAAIANQMLSACADMLIAKIQANEESSDVNARSVNARG